MKILSLLIVLALAVNAAGCGQKGPLVLPDAQHPRKKARFPGALRAPSTQHAPAQAPSTPAAPAAPSAPASAPSSAAGPAPQG